ncbi:hypothetical protein [Pseudomonas amygdali]|uniref:hypothetical protein n=1 Tax=Pseudomonas amygdali TaxID=47877 RepID=UPI0001CC385C|nr:hypothetical protein [Pseudomonas amygdali]KWS11283.1 transcriptional regulator [Pseudomonas amygdali pv. ulmi]KWT05253.1 transcriptional regulator [Pseudomonas amygdali pv. aesculi]KWT16474.1 transcriptional regulator [Pseudomonas amygdali pv. aesculi]KWT22980.1 transcriptional regulator [Pseudomonas amygdali pv. aesculi]KWT26611.1 transcriptional regulator [Pseudomonas amygdali pv. aesculi]
MKDTSHDYSMSEQFRVDPHYAAELLADVRLRGCSGELEIILRQMVMAFGEDGDWRENLTPAKQDV